MREYLLVANKQIEEFLIVADFDGLKTPSALLFFPSNLSSKMTIAFALL